MTNWSSSNTFVKKSSFFGLIEALNLKLIKSNHDIYLNYNAPEEVTNIKTHYENIFLEKNKRITYLSFQIK